MVVLALKWELQVLWSMDWSVSWALLQFLLASLYSWPKMPILLPLVKQNKSNFFFSQTKSSSRAFPSATSIFLNFIIVMPLSRKYHRILGMESTLKVHTVFFPCSGKTVSNSTQTRHSGGKKEKSQFTYCSWNFRICSIANLNTMQLSLYCPIVMTSEVTATSW